MLWREVAKDVGLDEKEVKDRWCKLKQKHDRLLKIKSAYKPSGSAASAIPPQDKRDKFFEMMDFMNDINSPNFPSVSSVTPKSSEKTVNENNTTKNVKGYEAAPKQKMEKRPAKKRE